MKGKIKKKWRLKRTFTKIKHNLYKNPYTKEKPSYCIFTFSEEGFGVVLAVTTKNEVIFVEQYRPAAGKYILNLPGGRIEQKNAATNEQIRKIKKELEEETYRNGKCWTAKKSDFKKLGIVFQNPTRITDKCIIFFAKNTYQKKCKKFKEESAEAGERDNTSEA